MFLPISTGVPQIDFVNMVLDDVNMDSADLVCGKVY